MTYCFRVLVGLCMVVSSGVYAQGPERTATTTTAGGIHTDGTHSLSFTIGEVSVETAADAGNTLTQGFQQMDAEKSVPVTAFLIDTALSLGDTAEVTFDSIEYQATVSNINAVLDLANIDYQTTVDPNTTFKAGSVHTTPVALRDNYTAQLNTLLTITAAAGILSNDVDPDGRTTTFTIAAFDPTSALGGTVVVAGDGSFTYNPIAGFTGLDSFEYTIQDSDGNEDSGEVFIHVK